MNMFEKISKEFYNVYPNIDRERILAMAPVYFFSIKKKDWGCMDVSLEQLLKVLVEQRVFSKQTAGWIHLSLEYGMKEENMKETLGLSEEFSRFKISLEEWLAYLHVQHQVSQGIVLIQINQMKDLLSEKIWWQRFFRQVKKYKNDYLFLFGVKKDFEIAQKWIGREFFCRKLQTRQLEVADYVSCFKQDLEQYDLMLNEQGEKILVKILNLYKECVNSHILKQWQQELVWEWFVKEQPNEQEKRIFPETCIDEHSLKKHIENCHSSSRIGFS